MEVNGFTHVLAKVALFYISSRLFIVVPLCIYNFFLTLCICTLISNEMQVSSL